MGDRRELFLISILAAFCSGLAWTHEYELFAAARWLQVFGCIGSETRLEKLGARSIAVASFATAAWGGASGHLECESCE